MMIFELMGYQFDSYSQSPLKVPDNTRIWIYNNM